MEAVLAGLADWPYAGTCQTASDASSISEYDVRLKPEATFIGLDTTFERIA
jgi:hypothetical protein